MARSDLLKKHLFALLTGMAVTVAGFLTLIISPGDASADCSSAFLLTAGITRIPPGQPFQSGLKPAAGRLLVAAANIRDPRFQETVILLLRYDSGGAMGLIINLPTTVNISSLFPKMKELKKWPDKLFIGGPVGVNRLFMLIQTDKAPGDSVHILNHTYVSSSIDTLNRMARHRTKGERFRVFAGYAGWAAGQLEHEVAAGSWYVTPAEEKLIFAGDPSGLWHELIGRSSGLMVKRFPCEGRLPLCGMPLKGTGFEAIRYVCKQHAFMTPAALSR